MVLPSFVVNPFDKKNMYFDFTKLKETIKIAVRLLDNVIDKNNFPDKVYENYQKDFRTIGLGMTGLADMLVMLGLRYDSETARKFVDKLTNFIALNAYRASVELAIEKGRFNKFSNDFLESNFLERHAENDPEWAELILDIHQYGIRNGKLLSVAPVGTLSLTFGNNCSSGIEPIFALEYERNIKMGGQSDENIQKVTLRDYAYEKWLELDFEDKVDKDVFVTALNISVDDHVKMLGVIARNTDMSVSKTINIPTEYSFEDTKNVYMMAHDLGVKGCTIFRPNEIRQGVLFDTSKKNDKKDAKEEKQEEYKVEFDSVAPVSRKILGTTHGNVYCRKCACGTLYITVACDDNGNIVETFVESSKGGVCKANTAAVNRMVSLALRSGVQIDEIIDQLSHIDCKACTMGISNGKQIDGLSCPDIISKVIKEFKDSDLVAFYKNKASDKKEIHANQSEDKTNHLDKEENKNSCPECGEPIRLEGGCVICSSCGWSKCG